MERDADKHGTISCYRNRMCRCEDCKAAWRRYMSEYRRNRRAARRGAALDPNAGYPTQ